MSAARAEDQLAAVLLVELLTVLAEDDKPRPKAGEHVIRTAPESDPRTVVERRTA
jgi:hypothetical protein